MSSASVPTKIRTAYEDFLSKFQKAAEDSNCGVVLSQRPIGNSFLPLDDNSGVSFETFLYVKNLRARRLPGNKSLNVAIHALEKLTKPDWSIVKSTVYLNYFVASGTATQLVQSMHYDFVQGGQPGHPMFHLQLDTSTIQPSYLRELGLDTENLQLPDASNQCWVTMRVPTSDMTFPSVLYCLAGDHLPNVIFSQFAQNARPIQERFPHLEFEALKKSMASPPPHFKSSHWFAHMFSGNN